MDASANETTPSTTLSCSNSRILVAHYRSFLSRSLFITAVLNSSDPFFNERNTPRNTRHWTRASPYLWESIHLDARESFSSNGFDQSQATIIANRTMRETSSDRFVSRRAMESWIWNFFSRYRNIRFGWLVCMRYGIVARITRSIAVTYPWPFCPSYWPSTNQWENNNSLFSFLSNISSIWLDGL